MQFLGALLLGRGVTDTVRKGIAEREFFEDQPEILMYGMFCALIAAGTWLLVATYFEMPVSTTHSIIGYALRPANLVFPKGMSFIPHVSPLELSWLNALAATLRTWHGILPTYVSSVVALLAWRWWRMAAMLSSGTRSTRMRSSQ